MAIDEARQRARFGGINSGSAFFGWLVATGVSVLLLALAAALGAATILTNNLGSLSGNVTSIGLGSAIMVVLALIVAYYAGGYVAGRMSRFDGIKQGLGVWMMGIAISIVLAVAGIIFGSNYNLTQQLNLPTIPVGPSSFAAGGLVTLLVALLTTLLAAMAGGAVGEAYHRRVDSAGLVTSDQPAVAEPVLVEQPVVKRPVTKEPRYGSLAQPAFGEKLERTRRDQYRDL